MSQNQEMLNQASDTENQYDDSTINTTDNTDESNVSDNDTSISNSADNGYDSDNDNEYNPTDAEIDNLSDEEFQKWFVSGEFPKEKRISKANNQATTEDKEAEIKEESEEESEPEPQQKQEVKPESKDTVKSENKNKKKEKPQEIDYKGIYERIFRPFKANGTQVIPTSVEDIISLMQQGANYTKKMQDLAPMRKSAESLIKAGINNEDLSLLIDVYNGNKDALKKLIKDRNINIDDIDLENNIDYIKNTKNIASDEDIDFQDALIDSKENLDQIRNILNNTWDSKSRDAVIKDPNLLRALNWEISSGRYEQVQKIVDSEKAIGRYKGQSDLEIYIQVASAIERGQLKRMQEQSKSNHNASNSKKTNRVIPSAGDKSKAAPSRGKPTPTKARITPEQLMNMSDEEFEKLNLNSLM